jgi:uncharacterized SAM-binding protein YcdF (DUF218 family)
VLALLLLSWPPVDWLLSRPLEYRYPIRPFQAGPTQAIVVLSSSAAPAMSYRPFAIPDKETYSRCEFAAWLYKNWQALPVLASAGTTTATMRELLIRAGVPEEMIWMEERSRSTHENALYSAQILRLHGIHSIALVVEARSMLRAESSFRKQGFSVVPAPSDFRDFGPLSEELIPSWRAIQGNEMTLHESLGFGWYWLRGWI